MVTDLPECDIKKALIGLLNMSKYNLVKFGLVGLSFSVFSPKPSMAQKSVILQKKKKNKNKNKNNKKKKNEKQNKAAKQTNKQTKNKTTTKQKINKLP